MKTLLCNLKLRTRFFHYSIPITQFKKKKKKEMGQSNTDSAVCLGELKLNGLKSFQTFLTPSMSGIDTSFQTLSRCHLCRSYVFDLVMQP